MRRIRKLLGYIKQARPYRSVPRQILDLAAHKIRINTSPGDYYRYEFFRNRLSWREKSRFVGQFGSAYWPYELNLRKHLVILTNKYVFKHLVAGFGLPSPSLVSTIGHHFEIKTRPQWEKLLNDCRRDIVLKPISSSSGREVLVLERMDSGFSRLGRPVKPGELWDNLQHGMEEGFLVEERVRNHPLYEALHPHSLNTIRVVTFRFRDEEWRVIDWGLKVGRDRLQVDNAGAGGIWVVFDRVSHITTGAYAEYLRRPLSRHPNTGLPLVGVKLPGIEEVFDLALTASRRFALLGTIGWDIALTDRGASLIEGNTLWGAESQVIHGGLVTDEMACGLKRHRAFRRWDQEAMYPHMERDARRRLNRRKRERGHA